jgi:hypothetical protein
MASKRLREEQLYTAKLLGLVSFIALVVIAVANRGLVKGNVTGAYSSGTGNIALGLVLLAGIVFVFLYTRKKTK